MHKTADFHSNLLVSWELVTGGYQGRPVKCVHLERPLPGMVILWFPHSLQYHHKVMFQH